MATKAKTNTSLIRNPPAKSRLNINKTNSAKRRNSRRATTRRATGKRTRNRRNSARYTRNPAFISGLFAAFGGALAITSLDLAINRVMPSLSGLFRTGVKFALGFGMTQYGNKLPLIGKYAPVVGGALILAGMLDVVGNYLMPPVLNYLGIAATGAPAQLAAAPKQVVGSNGEMGMQYQLTNGDVYEVFDDAAHGDYGNQTGSSFLPIYG